MKQDKVLSLIGLAQRAGRVASGEFATEKAVKSHQASVVFVAGDSSDNTKKMFTNMCAFYKIPMYIYSDREALGHSIGKQFRASLAVMDAGFKKAIEKNLKELEIEPMKAIEKEPFKVITQEPFKAKDKE